MTVKIRKADKMFSDFVRERDDWVCQRCKVKYDKNDSKSRMGLHTSHYWGRGRESTRFELDNCIALCYYCHRLWGHGDQRDQYKEFMINKLGEKRFKSLELQANSYQKRDDKLII